MSKRAAQFAPFAALHGHKEAIHEVTRTTEQFVELDPTEFQELSRRLTLYMSLPTPRPMLGITYFEPDPTKPGGRYVSLDGVTIKKVEAAYGEITLTDGRVIAMASVSDITGEWLD